MIGDTEYKLSKDWTNASDFPTYEENEEKVREDMQLLFDELRDCINDLVGKISAANIRCSALGDGVFAGGSIHEALAKVLEEAQGAAAGDIPDGTIKVVKLHGDFALPTEKIADGAVTSAKIASLDASKLTGTIAAGVELNVGTNDIVNAAVTGAKLAGAAVGTAKLDDFAVTTAKVADGAVTDAKIASVAASKVSGKVASAAAADTAEKMAAAAGAANKGVYVAEDGTVTPCTYEVNKSVPADAVFTDTVFTLVNAADPENSGTLGGIRISYGPEASKPEAGVAGQIYLQYVT